MKHPFHAVLEFHLAFGLGVSENPELPSDMGLRELRRRLMDEEFTEYNKAEHNHDLTNIAVELADIIYIACGTAAEYGIPLDVVFDAIHQANMAKLGPEGKPIVREDGKILKPEGWKPADIEEVLKSNNLS